MDRENHEYFFNRNHEMVVILREEILFLEELMTNPPAWAQSPEVKHKTKARLRATKEHMAEHQKDMVTHQKALRAVAV